MLTKPLTRSTPADGALGRRLFLPGIFLLLALTLTGCNGQNTFTHPGDEDVDFNGLVDIGGGRRLYLECRGKGRPVVILESGFRNDADIWTAQLDEAHPKTMVLPGVAEFTRVCAYDRPGTILDANNLSRSDPVPMPRNPEDIVADLHALLNAAHIPGPNVLVAHSLGGLFARLYVSTYPDSVAGLVLVDAWPEGITELLDQDDWILFEKLVLNVPPGLENYADLEVVDPGAASDLMRDAAASSPLRPIPFIVLSRAVPLDLGSGLPPGFPERVETAWQGGQKQLAALLPGTPQIVAAESSHYIQLMQPDLVINEVKQVVDEVRGE